PPAMHLAAASRLAALALLPAAALAQGVSLPASLGPDTRELNSLMPSPLMHASARVQQLFELGEIGQSQLTVHSVSLRFDGPSSGTGARHTIQKVTLRLGVSARSVATLGAVFD